jgi:CDP-diacylglycerol---glycerol-3-phosphate 3-phosphatidyltransferase
MRLPIRREQIPWTITSLRAALGPVMIAGAACNWSGLTLACMAASAAVADIFDGRLARRWKCDGPGVRFFDSMADAFFYVCVGVALSLCRPQIWHACARLVATMLVIQGLRWLFEILKFGKPASYHTHLARCWGVVLAVGVVTALATRRGSPLINAAMLVGIACNLEGIAMSLVLHEWTRDVRNLRAAWAIRRPSAPAAWAAAFQERACLTSETKD